MVSGFRGVLAALVAVVAIGAGYELAVALGLIGVGPQPGDPPAGSTLVVGVTLVALLVMGAVLLLAAPLSRRGRGGWGRVAVPVAGWAAGAFLVARFYSYDPYYAPALRRMADGGMIPGRWVVLLLVATLAAGLLARRSSRAGFAASAVGVWAIAFTAAVVGLGH